MKNDKNKILVVDDDFYFRDTLVRLLRTEDYDVYEAPDGNSALGFCRENQVDIMILDINLPDVLGVDVVEKIKSSDEFGSPKIIVSTAIAYPGSDIREQWMEYGVTDFIAKPYDFNKLLTMIQSL